MFIGVLHTIWTFKVESMGVVEESDVEDDEKIVGL